MVLVPLEVIAVLSVSKLIPLPAFNVIEVTVPLLLVLLFQVYFSPVVTNETSVPPLAAVKLE